MSVREYDIVDDADYLHVCAQLKAREFEFIEKPKLERMIYSAGIEDFTRILSETYYSRFVSLITTENNFDEIIINSNREIIDYLTAILKPVHMCVLDLLMFEENIHNYKTIFKSFITKQNLSSLFLPSLYSYEALIDEINGQGYKQLDKNTLEMLRLIMSLKDGHSPDIKNAEIELERAYIGMLYDDIKFSGNEMMTDFIKHLIDINNIKNIIRVKYANTKLDFNEFLYENGFLSLQYLQKLENESKDLLVQELSGGEYADIVTRGMRSLNTHNTFFSFEKNEYIYYLKFFERIKYTLANIEKIFSFFMRKKIETKILNIIYLGLLYGIEKGKIEHKVEIISEN